MNARHSVAARILHLAHEAGFELAAIRSATPALTAEPYRQWVAKGYYGEMGYLARQDALAKRSNPSLILPGARTVVTVGLNYHTVPLPSHLRDDQAHGIIASYAWGQDYHDILLPRLWELAEAIQRLVPGLATARAYVDTGPLLERELAAVAGLGFVGKNTNLIHRRLGSWVQLGELLLSIDVGVPYPTARRGRVTPEASASGATSEAPASPSERLAALLRLGTCGQCTRCLDACPTGALVAPYVLDARRCISYLTIEHRAAMPRELRPRIGNRIFGCDICQEVCPWNRRFASPTAEPALQPWPENMAPALLDLISLDDGRFRERFRGSPIQRAKRSGLLRNVAVALGNWGHPQTIPSLTRALYDPEPLVRGHAAWALGQIGARHYESRSCVASALSTALMEESSSRVREEMQRARFAI